MINPLNASGIRQAVIADASDYVHDNRISDSKHKLNAAGSQKEEYRKVAKEMESLFTYQLLKIMRETNNNLSDEKKDNGNDTYMSMFDMEISKLFAERGIGLQDAIMNWLERSQGADKSQNDDR
ncbi:MAG: rod-binding protein [Nitrospirota bacterium]